MVLTITDRMIESDVTRHNAVKGPDGWDVSWFGVRMDRNAAITAMTLTEIVARYEHNTPGGRILAQGLAHELDIPTVEDAVRLIETRDQDHRYVKSPGD
jgi:hypothetical protein